MRVFISDLHLEDSSTPAFRTFRALLERESERARELFILGDLCEVWIGDDDDGAFASALKDAITSVSGRCRVYVMHGNRDFLLGNRFAAETGCVLLDDPAVLDDGTLLAHGDAFCVDDLAYQQTRATLRSPEWQQGVLSQSLDSRRGLARAMREQSRSTNANKAANIMDVADREVARVVRAHAATRLVHGHTHRPGVHRHPWGTRYVLGAWERCGWLLRIPTEAPPALECFPLAGHYGI